MAAAAILKIEKSPYLRGGLTDFDEIWHDGAVRPSWPTGQLKIWKFSQYKMAAAAILKIEKSPYLGRGSTDFDEIWHAEAFRHSWPPDR